MDAAMLERNLDDEGFLVEISGWSREVGEELAERNQLGPLTDDHWAVIEFVREYYNDNREGPAIVKIAKATGLSMTYICQMFPCGVGRGAYRLAGLPRPAGCL